MRHPWGGGEIELARGCWELGVGSWELGAGSQGFADGVVDGCSGCMYAMTMVKMVKNRRAIDRIVGSGGGGEGEGGRRVGDA